MKNIVMAVVGLGTSVFLVGCQPSQPSVTPTPVAQPTAAEVEPIVSITPVTVPKGKDPLNSSYVIDGQVVTLVNGKAQVAVAPGSATMATVTVFGQPTTGDVNGDGVLDAAVMLTVNAGGSGTFFYEAVAVKTGNMYTGTNAVLLGDRISPQTTQIANQIVIVNFAERAPGEPMTAQPSVGVSKYLELVNGILVEAANPNQAP